jgi:protein required for attachment to host cells
MHAPYQISESPIAASKALTIFRQNNKTSAIQHNFAVNAYNHHCIAMYERAAHVQDLLVTWVLAANGKQAQLYHYKKVSRETSSSNANHADCDDEENYYNLSFLPNEVIDVEPLIDYQMGRKSEPLRPRSSGGAGIKSSNNTSVGIQHRYVNAIALHLQDSFAKHHFDRLMLVMPVDIMKALKQQLSYDVRATIIRELPQRQILQEAYT